MFDSITYLVISVVADVFTIIGVIFAIGIYLRWKHNYKLQKSHEYALFLLKKIKHLHLEIESLRGLKFYNPETLSEDIEKKYIPQIEETILKKISEINIDLFNADKILVKHKELPSKFSNNTIENIISPLQGAVFNFFFYKRDGGSDFEVKNTELFKIIFPVENISYETEIKKSDLRPCLKVVNDDFNKKIESMFKDIYGDLEANLASNKNFLYKIRIKNLRDLFQIIVESMPRWV